MRELVLHVTDIDEIGKNFEFVLTPAWLDQALADTALRRAPGSEGGALQVHAQRSGHEFLVRGRLSAALVTECGRCLGDAPFTVDTELTALLTPGEDGEPAHDVEDVELEAEDLDRVRFTGPDLVLDDLVREQLVLECPMQPLCSPDCRGIDVPAHVRPRPEDFGTEGGVDPRLAPLEQLRDKLASGSDDSDHDDPDLKE